MNTSDPRFILDYSVSPTTTDYRCVVDATASNLIFERSALGSASTKLYVADLSIWPPEIAALNQLPQSSRPDWCWSTGQIAFSNEDGVWLQDDPSAAAACVSGTKLMLYPAWSADGQNIVTDNGQNWHGLPMPHSTRIARDGTVLQQAVTGTEVYAGMPAVNPANASEVAFAGQAFDPKRKYDQTQNYIWIVDAQGSPRPLDKDAPSKGPFDPKFQGRAPWWSPDGRWIAFESLRSDEAAERYAIFVQRSDGSEPAVQVTDKKWNANHAKWYPTGKQLVLTAVLNPETTTRGIASIDVSSIVAS